MSWVSLISAGLQLALALINWVQGRQQFTAGQDSEIAKTALAILEKTEAGKRIMEKINAMPDGELDNLIDDLGR
ncbi:MAG: hypothetical protein WC100_22310 [Sterolibacterium sp.]